MKLKTIKLTNFRGVENLEIPFDGKSTILFGINGVGKSSVLRAVDLIYANIIARLTASKKLAELQYDDISYGRSKAIIEAVFSFYDGSQCRYARSIHRALGRKHKPEELKNLAEEFEACYVEKGYDDGNGNWTNPEDTKNMPVFVNYGVNRLVLAVPVKAADKESYTKLHAFDKAIESKIDFKSLFIWFGNQEDIENQDKVRKSADYEDRSLAAVKEAIQLKSYRSFIGWDANVILEEVMNTSSVNQQVKEQVAEMFAYIADKQYDKAVADMLE